MLPLCNRNTVKPNKRNQLRKNLILKMINTKMQMSMNMEKNMMRRVMVMKKKINSMPMITLLNYITLKISRELNNRNLKKVAKSMKFRPRRNCFCRTTKSGSREKNPKTVISCFFKPVSLSPHYIYP